MKAFSVVSWVVFCFSFLFRYFQSVFNRTRLPCLFSDFKLHSKWFQLVCAFRFWWRTCALHGGFDHCGDGFLVLRGVQSIWWCQSLMCKCSQWNIILHSTYSCLWWFPLWWPIESKTHSMPLHLKSFQHKSSTIISSLNHKRPSSNNSKGAWCEVKANQAPTRYWHVPRLTYNSVWSTRRRTTKKHQKAPFPSQPKICFKKNNNSNHNNPNQPKKRTCIAPFRCSRWSPLQLQVRQAEGLEKVVTKSSRLVERSQSALEIFRLKTGTNKAREKETREVLFW